MAADWFSRFEGAGLDGVVAKDGDLHYLPDKRAMLKVKHQRTADCVVAGFRTHKDGAGVGSLLLGLYDPDGTLHHVGVASGFSVARRRELVDELEPYRQGRRKDHPWAGWAEARRPAGRPAATNRWNAGKDMTWEPLRPEAVCEVSYDHLQQDRFRHATSFVRWRPDREPASCTYAAARHAGADGAGRRASAPVRRVSQRRAGPGRRQLGAHHRLPEADEALAVARPSGRGRLRQRRHARAAGGPDVPGLLAALLERDRPLVHGPGRAAEHENAVAGQQRHGRVAHLLRPPAARWPASLTGPSYSSTRDESPPPPSAELWSRIGGTSPMSAQTVP